MVIVPVPWEPTTSYGRGTAKGPAAILAASRQVDLFDLDTGRPYEAGIAMLEEDPESSWWNAEAARAPSRSSRPAAGRERRPGAAGGAAPRSTSSSRSSTSASAASGGAARSPGSSSASSAAITRPRSARSARIAERYPGLGILHVDAHADLRDAYEGFTWSHASIMCNVLARDPGGRATRAGRHPRLSARTRHALIAALGAAASSTLLRRRPRRRALRRRGVRGASCERDRRDAAARRLRLVRHRRPRSGAVPAHRHAGARRPLVPRGGRAARRVVARAAARSSASTSTRSRPAPTATSGTPTSAVCSSPRRRRRK